MAITRALFGRRTIYTDETEITRANILDVLQKALNVHSLNAEEERYLFDYYRGKQPIFNKEKSIRPEINNKIVENRANEIVSFETGYVFGEPVQYVNRGREAANDGLARLNEYMYIEDGETKHKKLGDDMAISGVGYKVAIPNDNYIDGEAPFKLYVPNPANTFVVYHNGLDETPLMGVFVTQRENNLRDYCAYTKDARYLIRDGAGQGYFDIISVEPHYLGDVPVFEYQRNNAKLGAFEIVLPILDAMNNIASNREDAIEQFVQALMVVRGVDIESEDYSKLTEMGGISLPADGDINYLVQELNQTQTQALIDYMYQTVLTICGMPNRNGGSSTSDTGSAVIMRDGWSDTEARAKNTEALFKCSEKRFLRMVLKIIDTLDGRTGGKGSLDLKLSDIDIRFTRRNYENIVEKMQVLIAMLNNDKIHPLLAFEHCGMFADPGLAYSMSTEYYEEQTDKQAKELEAFTQQQVANETAANNAMANTETIRQDSSENEETPQKMQED